MGEKPKSEIKFTAWVNYGCSMFIPSGESLSNDRIIEVLKKFAAWINENKAFVWQQGIKHLGQGVMYSVYNREAIVATANEIIGAHGLRAEIEGEWFSVGVGGDEGTYTPILNLIGPFPGDEVLARLSSEISGRLPINRVTFQLTHETEVQ